MKKIILLILAVSLLQGCTAIMIGTAATKATIAVAKVPFKVGGAVIGAVRHKKNED